MQIGIRLHDTKKGTLEERVAIAEEQGFSCAHLALKKVISEYSVADSALTPGFSCYLKKLFAAVLAVLLALSFSGCSELTGLDAQALMSPPKTTADREAIYALMGGGVGDVTLVYPKCGD